jgi:hypothetical protein
VKLRAVVLLSSVVLGCARGAGNAVHESSQAGASGGAMGDAGPDTSFDPPSDGSTVDGDDAFSDIGPAPSAADASADDDPLEDCRAARLGRHIDVRRPSLPYDIRIALKRACSPLGTGECSAPGEVAVFAKGERTPIQRLSLASIVLVADDDGRLRINTDPLQDTYGTLSFGDFNFDGHADLAVEDSDRGPYGMPTYAVFLYRTDGRRFVRSAELTELTHANLGIFDTDPEAKRLRTESKDGCCYHVDDQYELANDRPVLVDRVITDGRSDDGVIRTTHRWLEGETWHETRKRQRMR